MPSVRALPIVPLLLSFGLGSGCSSSGNAADAGNDGGADVGTQPDAGSKPVPDAGGDGALADAGSDGALADAESDGAVADAGGDGSPVTDAAGSTDAPSTDATAGADANDGGAPFQVAPPQVVNGGGPVLIAPKLVPVFFPADALQSNLASFVSQIGASPYWAATTSEYGVGAATSLPAVALTQSAPATTSDGDIQTLLAGKLNGNDPAWPAADANTLYVLFYPSTTSITVGTTTSCVDFGAYHGSLTLDAAHGSANVAYAVVPRCPSFAGLSGIASTTAAASAQLVASVTDPYPNTSPAYATVDDAHAEWGVAWGGGEVSDMCAQLPGAFTTFSTFPFTVQRTWSNASAKAGHDPCVPALPGEVYFNTEPLFASTVPFGPSGATVMVDGIQIAAGQSATVPLHLFSDGATSGPWTVSAVDFAMLTGGAGHLTFSYDKTSGQSGDTIQLTIKVTAAVAGGETFLVKSTLGSVTNFWLGAVVN